MNAQIETPLPASAVRGPLFLKVGTYDCCNNPQLRTLEAPSLAHAASACLSWIAQEDVRSRDWCGGEVFDAAGACVAVVSYNGRAWAPSGVNPEGQHVAGPRAYDLSA